MKSIIKKYFLLAMTFVLSSCSGIQRKIAEKRLDKAVSVIGAVESIEIIANKHGIARTKVDSFIVYKEKTLKDTFIIPVHDTIEKVINRKDVEIRVRRIRDTIQVEAKCRDTSVYIEKITGLEKAMDVLKHKYQQEIEKEKQKQSKLFFRNIFIILFFIIILFILFVASRFLLSR